jgi:hypothetical protein
MALTNLTVQVDGERGPFYQPGWDFYLTDLNSTVGGKYIYIGYQTNGSQPITNVNFIAYSSAQANSIPGWNWSPADLNSGAGGKYIYMYWNYDVGQPPIQSLAFVVTNQSVPPQIPGFQHVGCDLNEGAGGDYIWAYYSTTEKSVTQVKELFTRPE